jgi:hypothetical protein
MRGCERIGKRGGGMATGPRPENSFVTLVGASDGRGVARGPGSREGSRTVRARSRLAAPAPAGGEPGAAGRGGSGDVRGGPLAAGRGVDGR